VRRPRFVRTVESELHIETDSHTSGEAAAVAPLRAVRIRLPEYILRALETVAAEDGMTFDAALHGELIDFAGTMAGRIEKKVPAFGVRTSTSVAHGRDGVPGMRRYGTAAGFGSGLSASSIVGLVESRTEYFRTCGMVNRQRRDTSRQITSNVVTNCSAGC
jgi:hypothetical protein